MLYSGAGKSSLLNTLMSSSPVSAQADGTGLPPRWARAVDIEGVRMHTRAWDSMTQEERELEQLETMAEQGLVVLNSESIKVTAMGWFFVRGIAMVFDRYLQADRNRARFSRII